MSLSKREFIDELMTDFAFRIQPEDIQALTSVIGQYFDQGYTLAEASRTLSVCEEINPDIEEHAAIRIMERIRKQVEARQQQTRQLNNRKDNADA